MSEEVRNKLEALLGGVKSSRREMLKRMLIGGGAVALLSPVATLVAQNSPAGANTGDDDQDGPSGRGKGKGKGKGDGSGKGKGDGSGRGKGKGDGSGRGKGKGRPGGG